MKMTLHHQHPPPPPQTKYWQYLSCYWPDFDETLKVGSWEHLEQIPTLMVTIVNIVTTPTQPQLKSWV